MRRSRGQGLRCRRSKVYALSDLNFDRKASEEWVNTIDDFEFQDSVLILKGVGSV